MMMWLSHSRARWIPRSVVTFTLLLVHATCAHAAYAQAVDVLQGHVRGSGASVVPNASVTVTARDGTERTIRTDSQGAYKITFAAGSGPYKVAVRMLGFAPQTKQVAAPAAGAALQSVDFQLEFAAQTLAPVAVKAVRQKPQRDRGNTGVGEAGLTADLTTGMGGDVGGDLAAALGTVPGLLITPDPNGGLPAISAFGLSGDQNSLTLNGMNFGAGSIPRDGLAVRVTTSTYDPGRGGFSGVQTNLRLASGANLVNKTVHLTGEHPSLQGASPSAANLGAQYSRGIVSGAWSGPIIEDKSFYSTSYQVSRRTSDFVSLTTADAASLQSLGVSADSVARLESLFGPLGIPVSTRAVPSDRLTTSASFLSRFDWAPNVTSRSGNIFYVIAGGNWLDNAGTRGSPTALASHGADARSWAAQIQANSARYIRSVLNEANLGFVSSSSRSTPYLTMPDGRLTLNSTFADGTAGSSVLRFGGNSGAESNARTWALQGRNETSWLTMNAKHQYKATIDARFTHDQSTQNSNRYGTFAYNSLSDFAAGTPASFTRTLTSRDTRGSEFIGAVGVGDVYRRSPRTRFQYGVRLEGNRFGNAPAANPAVESLFSRSTTHVPNAFALAPMLGFTRQYAKWNGGNFTGGVREYVGTLSSQAVQNVARQTGLPSGVQQLSCVGAAVPLPVWISYATDPGAIPETCADGTGGTVFSQTTPPVTLFAPNYDPSRRWGASLGWSGRVKTSWIGSVTGNYSLNLHRPSTFDLNFNPTARFSLDAEGGRPVYVTPASIVSSSGAISTVDSRVHQEFAQVTELRSDLRSDAKQIIFGIAPVASDRIPGSHMAVSYRAYYTLNLNREQVRGFGGGTTDGDPRTVSWSTSGLPQHSFQMITSIRIPRWINIDAFARISSGRKYTPMIAGDINGDGQSNDRAFVFDPAATADTAVTRGMSTLLGKGSRATRDCLSAQLRHVAARNSCNAPWTPSMNLAISVDPNRVGLGDRGSISLVVTNVLAAFDQLVHGSGHLRNWGAPAAPDPTLLTVRGFDPVANRYRYDVNPLFGSTVASRAVSRIPFAIAIDVQLRLGPDRDAQMLRGFLKPTRADATPVLTATQIKQRLDNDAQNNFADIAGRKNAVKLTQQQVDALTSLAKQFDAHRDSIYVKLSEYLASVQGKYKTPAVKRVWHDNFVAIARVYVLNAPTVRRILSDEQFAALPVSMTAFFDMDLAQFEELMRRTNFSTLLELITGEGPD
jgi:hypothetical protein